MDGRSDGEAGGRLGEHTARNAWASARPCEDGKAHAQSAVVILERLAPVSGLVALDRSTGSTRLKNTTLQPRIFFIVIVFYLNGLKIAHYFSIGFWAILGPWILEILDLKPL